MTFHIDPETLKHLDSTPKKTHYWMCYPNKSKLKNINVFGCFTWMKNLASVRY